MNRCWRWSPVQHPGQSHPVTLSTWMTVVAWLLLLVMCLLLFHNFLSGRCANASECCSPVHTRFSDIFIPDVFSSVQNLYTFSIIAPVSSLYLHTSLAILLSVVALHVHNTSKHALFCKHVNREKFPASLRKQKKKINKKRFCWGSNPQPWAQTRFFVYNRYTYCAIESLVKIHL